MTEKNRPSYSLAPNIEYHRNRAKALLRDLQAGEIYAIWEFRQFHPDGNSLSDEQARTRTFSLNDAQTTIARANGFANWPQFKDEITRKGPVPGDLKFIGFVSEKMAETKAFYLTFFNYTLHIDEPDALIIRSPRGTRTLGFFRPASNDSHVISRKPFAGHGVYLTFGTDNVIRDLTTFQKAGIAIETGPISTAGERLFMVRDPNGIGIYVSEPSELVQSSSSPLKA